jgi:hypothetical protein
MLTPWPRPDVPTPSTLANPLCTALLLGQLMSDIIDIIKKLCAHISGLRMADIEELQQYLGEGLPEGEQYIKDAIRRLLNPSNPFP